MKLERRFCAPLTALAAFVLSCVSLTAQADTLVDIYELALENDALLKAKVAQYGADLELENLALAPLLPQATAGYQVSETETDTTSPTIIQDPNLGFVVIDGNSVRNVDNEGYDVSLSQTLFNLSAWFGWRAGKETSRQAEANLAAAQQDLIVRVVQAYFSVLRAQDNLRASQAQERAFERQLEQTRQRFEVGLIAITDVYEAEAARDLAQVTRIVDENNVAVAKENLSVLTGQAPGALYVLGKSLIPNRPNPAIERSGSTLRLPITASLPRLVMPKKPRVKMRPLPRWNTHRKSPRVIVIKIPKPLAVLIKTHLAYSTCRQIRIRPMRRGKSGLTCRYFRAARSALTGDALRNNSMLPANHGSI